MDKSDELWVTYMAATTLSDRPSAAHWDPGLWWNCPQRAVCCYHEGEGLPSHLCSIFHGGSEALCITVAPEGPPLSLGCSLTPWK